ncbi:Centromere protein F [Bagarius yarrelli]|uniref:Centromere protein F n=1 Tax=Bagarius yarrelli TaxID=175774 RepID=A0A556V7N6_BAGYA|nr:Centromere protein F [Bagarius yarrelli]
MSWAAEDWTNGLSGLVLKKVQELQVYNEKLIRERQQRQLQLDNSEAALHKQKQKYEEVRLELGAVQRELVGVREQVQAEARARDRLSQDLQAKVAQVCTLEGQLDSTKTLVQNLTQEIKRLEAELEKLQKASVSGESMLFSTPCWNMNSPWDQSGKSSLRGEDVSKARQQLLFGDSAKLSVSATSSPFPHQPPRTSPPLRRKASQSEARPVSSVFPWERGDTRSTPRGVAESTHTSSSFVCSEVVTETGPRDDGIEEALRKEIDGLRVRVSGLQQELQLEKECCRDSESRLAQVQKELNLNEQNLTRSKDELARVHTRLTQEGDRAQAAEQRVKQLQEELKCQRQNAETSRCNAEQRRKEMEKDHQRELLELQRERQSMEKQHLQESNRLNQEIQQSRTQHNTLQSQYDKARLKSTQSDLTESQKREAHTQGRLTESLKENEGLSVSLEQLKKKEKSLEAEVKRLNEELSEALKLIKELQAKLAALQVVSRPITGENFSPVLSTYPSYSPPHQQSSQKKKTMKYEKPKISNREGPSIYSSAREPGEGIDSEHISEFGSEDSVPMGVNVQEGNRCGGERSSEAELESSITEQDTGIEDTDTDSCMSDSISDRMLKDDIRCDLGNQKSSSLIQGKKRDSSSVEELKKENSALRDELREIKRELDQRLDDLESQRRAEAEARTKLKQLSKKHSSQAEQHRTKAQELKEKASKLEVQLEQDRKECARLKELVATLEEEAEKRKKEGKRKEEETIEETIKLKEALAQMESKEEHLKEELERMHKEQELLQSELLKEREERIRDQEEKKKNKTCEVEGLKIAELQARLDQLQNSAVVEGRNLNTSEPLTYLQFGNQPNTTKDCTALENEVTLSLSEIIAEESPVELDRTSPIELENNTNSTESMNMDETTILVLEVERMRIQRDKEAERAKKVQKKFEALQDQVTRQTRQLTLAFENQSKHIEGLLREVQQRDSALQRQGEELQQSCQKELDLLKKDKQKPVMINSMITDTDKFAEKPSCAISTTTINTPVVEQKCFYSVNDKPLQSDQQSFTDVEVKQAQHGTVSAASDETNTSHVTLPAMPHTTSAPSDVREPYSVSYTENTSKEMLPEIQTVIQKVDGHAFDTNTHNSGESSFTETKELSKNLKELLKHSTDKTSVLQMVMNRLHEAQHELSELKTKHDQLTLQLQEVSRLDVLSLRQENNQIKQNLIECEPCLSNADFKQDESYHLTSATEENVTVTDLVSKESLHEQSGSERCPSAPVFSLNEQLQALQSELHFLSEKNKDQAEELQLWRLSALTPEETPNEESNSSPIVVVHEEQLVLSCSSTALHSRIKQSSCMVQPGALYQPMGYFEPSNADHQGDHQTLSNESIKALPLILKLVEPIADGNNEMNDEHDQLKMKIKTISGLDLSSGTFDHHHNSDNQIKQTGDQQPENQPCGIAFRPESREDGLADSENRIPVIDPNCNTEVSDTKDYIMSSPTHDELVIATHSSKRNATKQENKHSLAPDCQTSNPVLRKNDVDQQELFKVTGGTDTAGVKEVKCVYTQTEEGNTEVGKVFEGPLQRPFVLHASTQTHGEKTMLLKKEEEESDECTHHKSPPLSSTPVSETEKLLFSSSFPIPANPAHLAERIRRNRTRMSAAYDDTEYEPYGLPEVVMKGFADIPSGPACPYVLRRGLLGTAALPISLKEPSVTEADEEIDP